MESLIKRIQALPFSDTEVELLHYFRQLRLRSIQLVRAPSNYYDWSLEERRSFLNAASTFHLCKTIVLENTAWNPEFAYERYYYRYIAAIIQYEDKLNTEKVMKYMKNLQNQHKVSTQISKKHFHFRLADEDVAEALTGYQRNATTPFLMKTDLPILLSKPISALKPAQFWLGGGEVELKLGISVAEFLSTTNAEVAEIS